MLTAQEVSLGRMAILCEKYTEEAPNCYVNDVFKEQDKLYSNGDTVGREVNLKSAKKSVHGMRN